MTVSYNRILRVSNLLTVDPAQITVELKRFGRIFSRFLAMLLDPEMSYFLSQLSSGNMFNEDKLNTEVSVLVLLPQAARLFSLFYFFIKRLPNMNRISD